jgi:putative ABC transport system permease protein
MRQTLYLAWRYLAYHRFKTAILVTAITLIFYLPTGLRVLVEQSSEQLTARAVATPLLVGAKGSPLELVLNTLYFRADYPTPMRYEQVMRVQESGLALAIPMYVRFHSQGHPIVGTGFDYFEYRGLRLAEGRQIATLGECVVGSRVAAALGVGPSDAIISSPESVFDIAGVYPLKMPVAGVLEFSDSPDDDAIFVDVKTAWVIEGLGHGHMDMTTEEARPGVLAVEEGNVVANASVMMYNEITPDNIESYHFHGNLSEFPVTAVLVVPPDQRSSALLQGRYQSADDVAQIVRPSEVMDELLDTILTVQRFVVAGAVILGLATLASAALVFMLSLRLRRREMETLFKIGGSRASIGLIMTSEIIFVIVGGMALAALLTLITQQFGAVVIRAVIRM